MYRILPHGPIRENMNDATPEERAAAKAKWSKDDPRHEVERQTKKMLGLTESSVDDEDVHLQSAHDVLRSRITRAKREGKDTKALEDRLASVAKLISKKD